jgi:hypothetical protein
MIDGIPNRPLHFYQKDIIETDARNFSKIPNSPWNFVVP